MDLVRLFLDREKQLQAYLEINLARFLVLTVG